MKFTSVAIALLAFAFSARPATVTYTPGTGVLLYPENFFEANSNSIVQAIAGAFPGTGSGNASTNVAQGWSALQVFDDVTVLGDMTVPGTLSAAAFSTATPLGFASGGHGATDAAGARTNLGLVIGYDVQAYDANLAQLATVSWASGDVPYFDGSNLTNLATTAAGRTLLAAANAAAQWSALASDALQSGSYDAGTWDGVTGKAITPDQFRDVIVALPGGSNAVATVTPPLYLSNGVLTLDTDGLGGGGGGYAYLVTNVGGAFQSRDDGTNWVIMSATVSSNYAPVGTGRFLEGGYGLVMSNFSGTAANTTMRIKANGTTVFRDAAGSFGSGSLRSINNSFLLIRESDTAASLVTIGAHVNGSAGAGIGDFGGSTPLGFAQTVTNIAWNWATNNTLDIAIECETSTSTNSALGMRLANAFLRVEADTSGGSGTGDVVGQSTLAAYSSVTNFVADPTVSPYQTINADLTTAFTGVRFLHATNVAAGRQTTVLVFAGTNAAVSVALNSQFAFNTNLVALTTGQVLPVSFYGYGSSPTNVIATLGTIYTR